MHDLIPSPRALKRFVNVYRLLRASIDEKDWKAFIGEGDRGLHRPVLVLLGILMGYPQEATDILAAIIDGRTADNGQPVPSTFKDLLHAIAANRATGDATASQPGTPRPASSELSKKLDRIGKVMSEDYSCEELRPLAATVARFSFQSGRILLSSAGDIRQ
jgi:hypothetical protein